MRLYALSLACMLALTPHLGLGQMVGKIHPKSGASFESTYVWDGTELSPKSGSSFSSTWTFDGSEVRPKSGATFENTWTFDGEEWEPKSGGSFDDTWVVEGHVPVPVAALVVLGSV